MCHHFIKEKVEKSNFVLVYIPSKDNLLTKPLLKDTTRKFTMDLGLYSYKEEEKENNEIKKMTIIPRRVLDKV